MRTPSPPTSPQAATGTLFAFLAFAIWGLSPVYWKALSAVDAFEIILHRIVWSLAFLLPLLIIGRQYKDFTAALKRPRILGVLLITAILVGANWLLYVWAVNNGRVLEASLGYYINPLVNILLGMLFLGERLRRAQGIAVALAAMGVLNLALRTGGFPWVSMGLAFSFGFYGLLRKTAAVGALAGLAIETLLLAVPAGIWIGHLVQTNAGAFLHTGAATDWLLMGTGVLTATPLLFFNLAAKRITLATLGFIQYTGPTGMLILGVTLFGEPFTPVQMVTFGLIWTALAIYSWDSLRSHKRRGR